LTKDEESFKKNMKQYLIEKDEENEWKKRQTWYGAGAQVWAVGGASPQAPRRPSPQPLRTAADAEAHRLAPYAALLEVCLGLVVCLAAARTCLGALHSTRGRRLTASAPPRRQRLPGDEKVGELVHLALVSRLAASWASSSSWVKASAQARVRTQAARAARIRKHGYLKQYAFARLSARGLTCQQCHQH